MTAPHWPRPQWRDSGAHAFYLWFVFGDFADDFRGDTARYRTGGTPDGMDVVRYTHARIRAWDGYPLGGTMGTLFEGENAALFARACATRDCLPDPLARLSHGPPPAACGRRDPDRAHVAAPYRRDGCP